MDNASTFLGRSCMSDQSYRGPLCGRELRRSAVKSSLLARPVFEQRLLFWEAKMRISGDGFKSPEGRKHCTN